MSSEGSDDGRLGRLLAADVPEGAWDRALTAALSPDATDPGGDLVPVVDDAEGAGAADDGGADPTGGPAEGGADDEGTTPEEDPGSPWASAEDL